MWQQLFCCYFYQYKQKKWALAYVKTHMSLFFFPWGNSYCFQGRTPFSLSPNPWHDWEEFVLSVTLLLMNIWLIGWNVKRAAIGSTHYPPWKFQDNCGKERGGDKWWGTYWVRVYDLVGAPVGQSGPLDYSSVLIHMHSLNKCYSSYCVPITVWFIGWRQKQLNNINQNKQ